MATKLRFGVWIPTYAWGDNAAGADNVRRIAESIRTCEQHGIDVWVIDHLLSAPGLYGNAGLEPLSVLSYAAAMTAKVRLATGILVLPVRHPVILAKEISTLCHLSGERYIFGVGPGWYAREFEVTGSTIEERGRRTDEIIEAVVETASEAKALEASKAPFMRAMGTHRTWEHLQECYMAGSIDRINARIADLVGAGLEYLVLGPVTDDPAQVDLIAKHVVGAFA